MQVGVGAADRVHRPGRRRRLAVAAPRAAAPAGSPLVGAAIAARRAWCWCSTCSPAPTSASSACCGRWARWSAAATYFVISADEDNGLPPHRAGRRRPASSGGLVLALAGLVGCCRCARRPPTRRRTPARRSPGGCPVLALGLVTAALAYVTGIAAGRRLGSRLASFVALHRGASPALVFAWLLLGELPRPVQLARRRADPGRRRRGQAGGGVGAHPRSSRCPSAGQRASCRLTKTSRCSSRMRGGGRDGQQGADDAEQAARRPGPRSP